PPLTLKCFFKSLISSNFSCFMIALHLLLTHPLVAPLLALVHLAASKPLYVLVNFLYNQAYYSHKLSWHKGNELQMGSLQAGLLNQEVFPESSVTPLFPHAVSA